MHQIRQQDRLLPERRRGFRQLLRIQIVLAHLLDRNQPIAEIGIRRFIDSAEAAAPHTGKNRIAPLQHMLLIQQSCHRGANGVVRQGM